MLDSTGHGQSAERNSWYVSTTMTRVFAAMKLAAILCTSTVAIAALGALGGCAAPPTYNWQAERAAGYRVGPGDVIKINVWKHEELNQQQATVRPDGAITLPLIGDIEAEGKNVNEIAQAVAQKVARYYQDQPPVTVQVVEVRSYKIYVTGEVNRAGEFTPNHQVSVLNALALAGGFTRFANERRIVIIRSDARGDRRIPFDYDAVVDHGDLKQNLALQTGDTVVVP